MKLQVMSDLHEEFYRKEPYLTGDKLVPEADAVLLAGDIFVGPKLDRGEHYKTLGKTFYYIPGNHEYYGGNWFLTSGKIRDFFENSNVVFMSDDTKLLDNGRVRLIGSTLWTDFWVSTPTGGKEHHGMYCRRGMADFDVIEGLTTDRWLDRHNRSRDYIKHVLSNKHDGPTIVMTHFMPSAKSSHPRFHGSPLNGGFYCELDHLIEEYQPDYWIHGHTHDCFDYMIGKTRVICNPKGYPYANGNENKNFNTKLIIEV
jgi:predicted phosphohydrolase